VGKATRGGPKFLAIQLFHPTEENTSLDGLHHILALFQLPASFFEVTLNACLRPQGMLLPSKEINLYYHQKIHLIYSSFAFAILSLLLGHIKYTE
jgi:hypothetical protein